MSLKGAIGAAAAGHRLRRIGRVVLVGSGKGGVGKSTVACSLALTLAETNLRTGLLDLDIHGASVPGYLGIGPPVVSGREGLMPKMRRRLKVMSVGFFTGDNPVPMRGGDKAEMISQLFGLTDWGDLDYLVVDLPPSMGDELLASIGLFGEKSILLLVTTPSPASVEVVSRMGRLARDEGVPILGTVVNMAYVKSGRTELFPFGRPSRGRLRRGIGTDLAWAVPLEPALSLRRVDEVLGTGTDFARVFYRIAASVEESGRHASRTRKGDSRPVRERGPS